MTLDHRSGSREIAEHVYRTPDAYSGPWAHPPRKPERRLLPGGFIFPAAVVSVALAIALAVRVF